MSTQKIKSCSIVALILCAMAGCQKQVPGSSGAPQAVNPAEPSKAAPAKPLEPAKTTHSGPFGLAGGMSVEEIEKLGFKTSDSSPGIFTGTPPKPLEGFKDYFVVALPNVGLCRIRTTHDIDIVNGTGDQLRKKADRLAETMAIKYGKHTKKFDYSSKDVYKKNPEYWMVGLKEESVVYGYDWSEGKTEQPLPEDLDNIEINTHASTTMSGFISINYTYKNFKECATALKKQQANSL